MREDSKCPESGNLQKEAKWVPPDLALNMALDC